MDGFFSQHREGDQYVIFIEGQVRETGVFSENLLLKRGIEARLGDSRLSIFDTIIREGFHRIPQMLLYHVNAGFPVVDDGSRLIIPSRRVTARDVDGRREINSHNCFSQPLPDYREQVFFHEMGADAGGYVATALVNLSLNNSQSIGFCVRYGQHELPCFNEWEMMGESVNAVGMEPATNFALGRAKASEGKSLRFLMPGEERHYHVESGVLTSQNEIARLEQQAHALRQ